MPLDAVDERIEPRRGDGRHHERHQATDDHFGGEVPEGSVGVQPGIEHQHAHDVGDGTLVDHELPLRQRQCRRARDGDRARDHGERQRREHRRAGGETDLIGEDRGDHRQGQRETEHGRGR